MRAPETVKTSGQSMFQAHDPASPGAVDRTGIPVNYG
jgi:hypothetical protein